MILLIETIINKTIIQILSYFNKKESVFIQKLSFVSSESLQTPNIEKIDKEQFLCNKYSQQLQDL